MPSTWDYFTLLTLAVHLCTITESVNHSSGKHWKVSKFESCHGKVLDVGGKYIWTVT